jgi:hypothetical protein
MCVYFTRPNHMSFVRFLVFMVVNIEVEVWVVTPYSVVIGYCCFGEPCFLLHSEDGGSKVL